MKERRTVYGFTIIELLVVVSIISVLAALLFPVFQKAKAAAHSDGCISNLHQISMATQLYATDSDDHLPYGPSPYSKTLAQEAVDWGNPGWLDSFYNLALKLPSVKDLLKPYGATEVLWICPLDRMDPLLLDENPTLTHPHKPTWYKEVGSSYDYDDVSALRGLSLSGYENSSQAIIFCDLGFVHGPIQQDLVGEKNLVFADGHAKLDSANAYATEFLPATPNAR